MQRTNEEQLLELHANQVSTSRTKPDLVDWLIVFAKRKNLILVMPVLFAACAALISLAMPDVYRAGTKFLPREESKSNVAAIVDQLSSLAGSSGALTIQIPIDPNTKIPLELYVSMLRSRSVADNLIQRFDLKRSYNVELADAARQLLSKNTVIRTGKDGLIVIEVEDKDPKQAAQIANAYVDELYALTKTMALTEASRRRLFFQRQLESSKEKLTEARATLKGATDARGLNDNDESRSIVESAAALRAQISIKEIQLSAMQVFAAAEGGDYNWAQQQLAGLRQELAKLEAANPFANAYSRDHRKQADRNSTAILHDAKYYEVLSELLGKQYEMARLDEGKDFSIIEVLDKAEAPEAKVKPKRAFIVLCSALAGLLIAFVWVLLFDLVETGNALTRADQWERLKRCLRFR
jgi:tyrosine-protein kinase Etk/Wzc